MQFKDTNGATNNKVRRIYNSAQALYISRRNDDESLEANDLVIDALGNVLVGKSAASSNTVGFETSADGTCAITRSGGQPLLLNRQTSDGDIILFRKDGTTVGRIGSFAGVVSYIALDPRTSGVNGSGLMGGSVSQTEGTIQPTNGAGAKDDAAINLGVSTNRFKDAYLSGGVYLGGTGAANKLEDYEEGTWTPELRFGGATPSGIVQTSSLGYYTKVGNLVTVQVKIILSSKGAQTGNAEIYGLPFSAGANGDAGAYPSYFNNLNLTASQVPIGKSSGGAMELRYQLNGVANRMTNGHIEDTTDIRMFSSYYV